MEVLCTFKMDLMMLLACDKIIAGPALPLSGAKSARPKTGAKHVYEKFESALVCHLVTM